MSVIQKFIQENNLSDISDDSPLSRIRKVIYEMGAMPDLDYMRCPHRRMELKKNYSDSFLGWRDGVPTFPVRNQYGGLSYTILKKSLHAAKSMFAKTQDVKYLKLIKKIEGEMADMESKMSKRPQTYHPPVTVNQLVDKIREY